jgi:hypothetical protein
MTTAAAPTNDNPPAAAPQLPRFAVIVDDPDAIKAYGYVITAETAAHALVEAAMRVIVNDPRGAVGDPADNPIRVRLARAQTDTTVVDLIAGYGWAHEIPGEPWAHLPLYSFTDLSRRPSCFLDEAGRLVDGAGYPLVPPPGEDLRFLAEVPARFLVSPPPRLVTVEPLRARDTFPMPPAIH